MLLLNYHLIYLLNLEQSYKLLILPYGHNDNCNMGKYSAFIDWTGSHLSKSNQVRGCLTLIIRQECMLSTRFERNIWDEYCLIVYK